MSQSISLMALHESRKKRLLKLFRRAKRNDEPESNTTSEKATGNNGKQRDALAISSSQDRNIGQAFLPSHGIGSQSEYTLPRNDLATPHIAKYRLPHVPCEREFSSSFRGLTLNSHKDEHEPEVNGDGFDEGRNSEYIADRNMSTASLDTPSIRLLPQKRELSQSKSQPLIPHVDRHSGNVADWNIVRNDDPTMEAQSDAPPPLKVHKRNSHLSEVFHSQEGPDTRDVPRGEAPDKRDASWSITPLAMEGSPSYLDVDGQKNPKARDTSWTITPLAMEGDSNKDPFENTSNTPSLEFPRPSLDKPLPPTPSTIAPRTPTSAKTTTGGFPNSGKIPAHAKQDSAGPMDLDDAEVRRFPDTVSLHEEQAPAVEHEKIIEKQHEVRQNVITREVHDHDIYHRILPIKDIEVKPARHFVPVQDGYVEVDEDDLPGRTRQRTNWAIAELVSKSTPDTQGAVSARHFTARKFSGTDGDDKEYIGPDGYPVKEKTWVHPPTLEQNTQGTHAFHFGSKDPKNDGLQAKLPAGNIVGVSKRLMERRSRMDIDS